MVEFDKNHQTISVYGKEMPQNSPFKLEFNRVEAKTITIMIDNWRSFRMGERTSFIVDCDGKISH